MPSLIQQRMALDRQRLHARWMLLWGYALVYFGVTLYWTGSSWFTVLYFLFALVVVAFGIIRVRAARRDRIAFETEHGPDAGKQDPVR
ncbi:hypothetical protein [Microbacterium aurantiacum]|uniref:hypothetical protein n=2 Tax=Microbacterium aurantiacum TaxID=162393 RepID=UPI004035EDA4